MRRLLLPVLALLLTAATPAPRCTHVFVIVLENQSLASVLGNPNLPTLNRLAKTCGLAVDYTGFAHHSLPHYVALLTSSDSGSRSDDPGQRFDSLSLPDQLKASGRSRKGYSQGLPGPGWDGPSRGTYAKKHNPFMLLAPIARDSIRTVPLEALSADLQRDPPNLALIVPDLCHDTHGAPGGPGDHPRRGQRGRPAGGRLATVVVPPNGPPGLRSTRAYNHCSQLRTLEDGWGLRPLGAAAHPAPMRDLLGW